MTASPSAPRDSPRLPDGQDRLDSWKEIAAFLEREVRTVQRWEKTEGLPVHRHHHARLGSVYAFKSELVAWKESRRAEMEPQHAIPAEAESSGSLHRLTLVSAMAVLAVIFALGLYSIWIVFLSPSLHPTNRVRLVVLPFGNIGADPEERYFADGMAEELSARLGRLNPARLGVIARTSAMQYESGSKSIAEIGSELDVDYVLEGGVRHEGDRTRVTVQLVQVSDQTRVWAESVEMDMASVFQVWDEVAGHIGARLAIELLSEPVSPSRHGSISPKANDAYLRGRYLLNKRTVEDIRTAMSYFEQSLEADAAHARAYAGLADAYALLGSIGYDVLPPIEAMPKAREAALKALSLDQTLAEAHTSLAYATMVYDRDWDRAEAHFQQAISLDAGTAAARHWYAYFLSAMGRPREALEQIRLALELDPVSLSVNAAVGWHLYFAGRYDEAVAQLARTLELEPDFALAHFELGVVFLQQGRASEAVSKFERAARASENAPLHLAALGVGYARAGRAEEARETLVLLERRASNRFIPAIYVAGLHLALGDRERALDELERAYRERSDYLLYLNVDPAFRDLRDELRFQSLLKKLGLPKGTD